MLSLAIQPSFSASASCKPSALSYHPLELVAEIPFKSSISARPKATSFQSTTLSVVKVNRVARRNAKLSASSAAAVDGVAEETSAENSTPSTQLKKEKLGVIVKPMQRPRLVLKFIWMEKNIGLGLNQVIPGHGIIPLSPYYFWPRKDAWEELKVLLESKPWISQKQMIILLNQATDIINLWQQSGGDLS